MASVVKRGKKWTAIYTDHRGIQRWKTGYHDKGETQRLAQRLEDEARKIKMGDVDPQVEARRVERSKPAADHLAAFRTHLESKARNQKYVGYTCRDCELFLRFSGTTQPAQVTLDHVDRWRTHLRKTGVEDDKKTLKPDSRKTCNRRIASLRAFLRYCHRIGALDRVVLEGYRMLDTQGHETKRRRALSKEEVALLLKKCPDDHRKEIYRFALLTGFRRSEIVSMTPSSFHFERRTITVLASDAKYKGEHQTVPMHTSLVEPLQKLCESKSPSTPVFKFGGVNAVVSTLRDDCKAAGVDPHEVDFHALRHTFISSLADLNIRPEVLMHLARHRDIKTTLRYYVHWRPDDERAALERLVG